MSVLSVEQYREIRNILIQAPTDDILRSGISPSRINLEYIGLYYPNASVLNPELLRFARLVDSLSDTPSQAELEEIDASLQTLRTGTFFKGHTVEEDVSAALLTPPASVEVAPEASEEPSTRAKISLPLAEGISEEAIRNAIRLSLGDTPMATMIADAALYGAPFATHIP